MTIYIDIVFFINFFFDSILLFSTSLILKRNTNFKKIFLSSFIGAMSIFALFIKINSLSLFIIKNFFAFFMVIVAFGYKNIKYTIKNFIYLYITSIVLGGFLYLINIEFSYKNDGIIFYNNGLSINFITLLVLSPIIMYLYIKQIKDLKNNYSKYYQTKIYFKSGNVIKVSSFLDTGNNLTDPYKKRPIIIINKNLVKNEITLENTLLIPYETIDKESILKCIKVKKINIIGVGEKENVLLGISNNIINFDGIDLILNNKLIGD